MQRPKFYNGLVIALFIIPIIISGAKLGNQWIEVGDLLPKEVYEIHYEFDIMNATKDVVIKAFVPESSSRQKITELDNTSREYQADTIKDESGKKVVWQIDNTIEATFQYAFEYQGKAISYDIPSAILIKDKFISEASTFLLPEEHLSHICTCNGCSARRFAA